MRFFISFKKWFLLTLLLMVCFVFFYSGLHQHLLQVIKHSHVNLKVWTNTHYLAAVSLYIFIHVFLVACAIPCATLLALIGGFLFGYPAFLYAMIGTTFGGTILFFAVRIALGAGLSIKSTGWVKKISEGFQNNAFNYLLLLRLIPLFPCWLSNITAGLLNIPLKTFVSATVLGIAPATLIYVLIGLDLDKYVLNKQIPFSDLMLTPSVFFPLLGLALISLSPFFHQLFLGKR